MTFMVPITEWSCSQHDFPQECDMGHWHCSECELSEYVKVSERPATFFDEAILKICTSRLGVSGTRT